MTLHLKPEPEPSDSLLRLVEEINHHFESAKEYVVIAYQQAISEGFTPQGARKFLYENITIFTDRTIRKYLPEEAKDLSKVRSLPLPNLTPFNVTNNITDFAEVLLQNSKELEKINFMKERATTNPDAYGHCWRRFINTNLRAMWVNKMHRKFMLIANIEEAKKQALERNPPNKTKSLT